MFLDNELRDVRLVLFDAVGTLIYPEPSVEEAYFAAGQRFGSRRSREEIRARFPLALRRYRPQALPAASQARRPRQSRMIAPTSEDRERERWRRIVMFVLDDVVRQAGALFEALWEHFALGGNWRLYPDVVPAWAALRDAGFQLGIASNFDQRLRDLCAVLAPLDRATHLFYSAALGFPKPHPCFYREIERRVGLHPGQLLLVGDDWENDVSAPRDLGWRAIYLRRAAAGRAADPAESRAVHSLAELSGRLGACAKTGRPDSGGLPP